MPSNLCKFVGFYILLHFVSVNEGSVLKARRLKKGKSFTFTGPQSYAIFENWKPSPHGALQLYFKTVNKDAFLMYIDDMGQREFIDLFLVNGSVRLRLTVGRCVMATTFVYGQFHDARWHRVFVGRKQDQTILIVDENRRSKAINCSGYNTFKVKSNIIMGSFNFSPNISSQDFALGHQILWETEKNSFQGCIRDVTYWKKNKFVQVKLLRTNAESGCLNACKNQTLNKCKQGTKCVNKIFTVECRCPGHDGEHCSTESPMSTKVKPTANCTNLTSVSPPRHNNTGGNLTVETKYIRNNIHESPMSTKVKPTASYTNMTSVSPPRHNNTGGNLTVEMKYIRNNIHGLHFSGPLVLAMAWSAVFLCGG